MSYPTVITETTINKKGASRVSRVIMEGDLSKPIPITSAPNWQVIMIPTEPVIIETAVNKKGGQRVVRVIPQKDLTQPVGSKGKKGAPAKCVKRSPKTKPALMIPTKPTVSQWAIFQPYFELPKFGGLVADHTPGHIQHKPISKQVGKSAAWAHNFVESKPNKRQFNKFKSNQVSTKQAHKQQSTQTKKTSTKPLRKQIQKFDPAKSCEECHRIGHSPDHCFMSHPDLLRKFLAVARSPKIAAYWGRQVENHKDMLAWEEENRKVENLQESEDPEEVEEAQSEEYFEAEEYQPEEYERPEVAEQSELSEETRGEYEVEGEDVISWDDAIMGEEETDGGEMDPDGSEDEDQDKGEDWQII